MSTATSQFVKLRMEDKVAVVTIDNPPANALNSATMNEFNAILDQIESDANIKAVVLTGASSGGPVSIFVAGADIKEIAGITEPGQAKELVARGQRVLDRLENLKKPVIAAINPDRPQLRASLVATQMLGLAVCRYVLRLPPVVEMSHDEIVEWLGPTVQRYLDE